MLYLRIVRNLLDEDFYYAKRKQNGRYACKTADNFNVPANDDLYACAGSLQRC